MTDQITVSRELLRQVIDAACSPYCAQDLGKLIPALREALEQPAVEPVASIYISADGEREFDDWKVPLPTGRTELFTAPQAQPAAEQIPYAWEVKQGTRTFLVSAQEFTGLSFDCAAFKPLYTAPQAQPEVDVSERVAECLAVLRPKVKGKWPAEQALDELARYLAAPQAQQPIGWLRAVDEEMVSTHLGVADITDSYEDAKRKLNTLICWHVDVSHDPKVNEPAQQPRKAVKLTDEELQKLVEANAGYGNNFGRVARAIEQAVLKKNGVEP